MSLDELDKLSINEVFDMMETPEGRETVEAALQKTVESDPELCEKIGQGFFSLLNIAAKSGIKLQEKQDDVLSFLAACKRLSEMPEEEAKALLEKALHEDGEAVKPERAGEIIKQTNYKKPEMLVAATIKVAKKIYDGQTDFTDGEQPITVSPKRRKEKFDVPVELFFAPTETLDGVPIQTHLTPFDKQVQNGIFTLIENGYTEFTANQVYEVIAGKPTTSEPAIENVRRSITKQRTTLIYINWTEHARMNGFPVDEQQGDYIASEENLLHLRHVMLRCNGQVREGYQVIGTPVLYKYAKQVGQIAMIDRKLLDVPVNNTPENIVLKIHLAEHIDTIKKGRLKENISFKTLYNLAGVGKNRVERQRLRETVEKILKAWVKKKFISGYSVIEKKQQIDSLTIQF